MNNSYVILLASEDIMSKLIELATNLLELEGWHQTLIPQVGLYKSKNSTKRAPLLYNQGVIFMLQGEKQIHTSSESFIYNEDNFLVITVPMPLECQGITKNDKPIIALTMDIEVATLNHLMNMMENKKTLSQVDQGDKNRGLFVAEKNFDIDCALLRLLTCLQDPTESQIFGQDIVKEIIYHILKQEKSAPLYALATKNTNLSKIESALKEVQNNYEKQFDVNSLAKSVNMSVSSFHSAFKNVTSSSPIQYIKKIRLNKAKEFLENNKLSVNEAAINVGYESVSQFNREFKRYFGVTPGSLNK